MQEKRFGALSSSVNPQELASTVNGVIKAVGGILVTFGVLQAPELTQLTGQIGVLVPAVFALYGVCETTFGLLRKIVVRLTDRQN